MPISAKNRELAIARIKKRVQDILHRRNKSPQAKTDKAKENARFEQHMRFDQHKVWDWNNEADTKSIPSSLSRGK